VDSGRLASKIWNFFDDEVIHKNEKKLGEIADIHVGITTMADKLYIFKVHKNNGNTTEVLTKSGEIMEMESDILKPITKASTLKSSEQPIEEAILFPYTKCNERHVVIREMELRENYPLAYAYLKSVRKELDKRDAGKPNPVAWYAFGRSQGLDTSFGAKILFSPMNRRPNFVWRPEVEATFYSGYCIKYDGDPELLLNQLNSERMQKHIESSGRDYRGGWKAYNKTNVSQFTLRL
jgi:adenine-specific DNA-methyltransferase